MLVYYISFYICNLKLQYYDKNIYYIKILIVLCMRVINNNKKVD
jgi:hypothetical protein